MLKQQIMKTIENRGAHSASGPISDMLNLIPNDAELIAAAGTCSPEHSTCEVAYSLNGEISYLSIYRKGGAS